ncbi:alpha/beta fold hydrolase [Gemmatimonas phototrophica]|uniref:alpha/beta fold hydrolase n=1 Tax=Gemmatimonas phototrophica TaxID=1379270 RepID=UPI001314D3F3|nr:alpha/beta hydrolase [Gemmatimonas phototrophica]
MYTEHLRIPVGAGALHVERLGRAGPAVVLLHGFGTCSFLWRSVAPALASAGCTVVMVDLLGFGESDRPAGVAYDLASQAEYVERALTALRLGAVSVVGQDVGALVGVILAARHPGRVQRLALLEAPLPDDLPGPAIRSLQRLSALSALSANSLFGARPLLEPLLSDAVHDPAQMPERLVMRYMAPWVGTNGAAELLQLASAISLSDNDLNESPLAGAELFAGQTLLWYGAGATLSGKDAAPARVAAWRALLPAATLRPLVTARAPGALVPEDDPAALRAALLAFLA